MRTTTNDSTSCSDVKACKDKWKRDCDGAISARVLCTLAFSAYVHFVKLYIYMYIYVCVYEGSSLIYINSAVNNSNNWMIVFINWKECGRKWSWPYFRALFRFLSGETKEPYEILTLDSRCPSRRSNQEPSKCKSGAVPLEPAYLILLF
jgi:hypothetical protein